MAGKRWIIHRLVDLKDLTCRSIVVNHLINIDRHGAKLIVNHHTLDQVYGSRKFRVNFRTERRIAKDFGLLQRPASLSQERVIQMSLQSQRVRA